MIIIASYSNVSVTYTADGTQTVFSFPFDYLRKAFVKVESDGNALEQETDFSVYEKTVVFTEAPAEGTTLRIFRETDTTPLVSWADASVLRAKDMTIQQIQVLHILEEYKGQYNDDLANMLIIAGVVTDSRELQHIVDQLNLIDSNTALVISAVGEVNQAKEDAQASATSASDSATQAENLYEALIAEGGHPFQAATIADMTDTTKIYVYVGNETDYINGNWYYYNGSAWVSGGVYNAVAFDTDTTLTISGAAADAKVTGDAIEELNESINDIRYIEPGSNLAKPTPAVVGAIMSDGTISTAGVYANQNCGPFIPIDGGETYTYSDYDATTGRATQYRKNYLFYDSSKTPIANAWGSINDRSSTITAPATASYIRLSWAISPAVTLPVLNMGSVALPYEPYSETYVSKMLVEYDGKVQTVNEFANTFVKKAYPTNKNLINPQKLFADTVINGRGDAVSLSGYTSTDYIPISAGQSIVVSPGCRAGALYTATKQYADGSYYIGNENTEKVFTATYDGYLRVSKASNAITTWQAEYGNTSTPYTPYDSNVYFEDGISLSPTMEKEIKDIISAANSDGMTFNINGNVLTATTTKDTKTLVRTYHKNSLTANKTFNFREAYIDSTKIKDCTDDITPLRIGTTGTGIQWTVGANHGWAVFTVDAGTLTTEDCGSIWTDGILQYTLMTVGNSKANFAYPAVAGQTKPNITITNPTADLTHVSGATHTDTVSITGLVQGQLYPSVNHVDTKVLIYGQEVNTDGTYAVSSARIVEHYEILDYVDAISYMRSHIGSDLSEVADNIDSMLAMDIIYEILPWGENVYTTVTALEDCVLSQCGFLQAAGLLANNGGTVYRYINGVKDGTTFASSGLVDMTTYNANLGIYKSDLINEDKPSNRCVDVCKNNDDITYGFTIGYIPNKGEGADSKRASLNYIWDMRGSKKIYPVCTQNKTLLSGEHYSVFGYRSYFLSSEITNKTVVPFANKQYAFLDAHAPFDVSIDVGVAGNDVSVLNNTSMVVDDVIGAIGLTAESTESYSTAIAIIS